MLSRILLPRSGNHAVVQNNDILMLWAMIEKKQLSWSYIIVRHMVDCRISGATLPYPGLVVKLLEHFEVSMEHEERFQARQVTHKFGEGTISKMKLAKNSEGEWVRLAGDEARAAMENAETNSKADRLISMIEVFEQRQNKQNLIIKRTLDYISLKINALDGQMATIHLPLGIPSTVPPPPEATPTFEDVVKMARQAAAAAFENTPEEEDILNVLATEPTQHHEEPRNNEDA